ncbi:hypothetical protein C8R43DRAFT_215213 [Mycena crocata]|nr:hypothetical protein C8R43DRAFT_215213 [Mycena crocata]
MRIALAHLTSLGRTPFNRITTVNRRFASTFDRRKLRYPTNALPKKTLAPGDEGLLGLTPDQQRSNEVVASFLLFMDLVKDEEGPDRTAKEQAWLRDRLRNTEIGVPSQPKIAENIIHFLFERHLFQQAVAVYQHMLTDGILPSPSTDALFLAAALTAPKPSEEDPLEGFETILAYSSFTETHFMELLDHIVGLDIPTETAIRLYRLFLYVKGEDYRPSQALVIRFLDLQAHAGEIEAAAETIDEYYDFDVDGDEVSGFDTPAAPYAQVILSAPESNQRAVDYIMDIMRERDVPIHITIFNSLISRQQATLNMRKAFAFYAIIIRLSTTTPLRPDATTYKLLFRLVSYQYKDRYKPNASRSNETIQFIPPPRLLFAQMISLWFNTEFHPPAATDRIQLQKQKEKDMSLLTLAFRAFLYDEDYAAAHRVLCTIPAIGLDFNVRLYFILMRHLTRKIYYDVHNTAKKYRNWAPNLSCSLVGHFNTRKIFQDEEKSYQWLMGRLLQRNCEGARQEGKGGAWIIPETSVRGRIPTVDEVLAQDRQGGRHVTGEKIDHQPLFKMLSHAMRVNVFRSGAWNKRSLAKSWQQMFAPDVELFTWKKK